MDTEAILQNGRTFVPARYVAEAFGAVVEWDARVRTVNITVPEVKEDKTGTEIKGGFVVPKDRDLGVIDYEDGRADIRLSINVKKPLEKQISELEDILSQKCDRATVEQVVDYVGQKTRSSYYLARKYIYDNKSQRYICVEESRSIDISILYLSTENSQSYKEYIGE